MQGWVVADLSGRSYLVRSGCGTVTAVVPVGLPTIDGHHHEYRVELDVDPPDGTPRAIRVMTCAQVRFDDPLLPQARACAQAQAHVVWAIEWHRHDWVPGHVLITGLDLATQAWARLIALDRLDGAHAAASPAKGGRHGQG